MDAPELNSVLSSATSSDNESALRMSERLCMVVEQLICPPRKKATLPSELNKGAVIFRQLPRKRRFYENIWRGYLTNI